MNKTINLTYILLAFILVTGCKTKKQIVQPEPITTDVVGALVKNVQEAEPQFRTANISKMNMNFAYDNRKLNNISASCRMKRDTVITLSIQPVFGIELFSVEINPDSITVIDKMNRKFYAVTYQYIFQKTGVPLRFENIQAMLTNGLFSIGETGADPLKLKTGTGSEGKRTVKFQTGKILQETAINNTYEIEQVEISGNDYRYRFLITYDQNQLWGTTRFPKKITVSGLMNKLNFSADFDLGRVAFDVPLTIKPASKSNLTRGNIEQILSK